MKLTNGIIPTKRLENHCENLSLQEQPVANRTDLHFAYTTRVLSTS